MAGDESASEVDDRKLGTVGRSAPAFEFATGKRKTSAIELAPPGTGCAALGSGVEVEQPAQDGARPGLGILRQRQCEDAGLDGVIGIVRPP